MEGRISVRPLTREDIPRLHEIDTGFTSDAILQVDKTTQGLGVLWDVRQAPLDQPLDKPTGYGKHVSLNPQRKAEIDRIIEELLD